MHYYYLVENEYNTITIDSNATPSNGGTVIATPTITKLLSASLKCAIV